MTKAPLDDYFDPIYSKEDASRLKPDPEVFLRVMNDFGAKPEECLIFEDSLTGMMAARNAGIEAVAVYDEFADADREQINALATWRIDGYAEAIAELERELG